MNQERPASEDVPGSDGIEVLQHQDEGEDSRERNGTGEGADEQQLGITEDEVDDLADDSKGG